MEAMDLVEKGLKTWADKEHNRKWWRKLDGTPIPNDLCVDIAETIAAAPVSTPAESGESSDLEEAVRLAEVGEYLFNACRYSGGDGYTEPREMGIDWQWQQSAPEQYGEGMLLAAATKWHDEQAEDGVVTEARKLRSAFASTLAPQSAAHRRVQDAAPARPEMDALITEAKAQAPQPGGAVKVKAPCVDVLAQEIRRVDGEHQLGAGALAEALMPFISAAATSPSGWDAGAFEAGAKAMLKKVVDMLNADYGYAAACAVEGMPLPTPQAGEG